MYFAQEKTVVGGGGYIFLILNSFIFYITFLQCFLVTGLEGH